jgi:hypothetical protein
MKLAISQAGRLHRPGCRHALGAPPWEWAYGKNRVEALQAALDHGWTACAHCRPFSIERDQQLESKGNAP